jgi:acetoacetyl-CoA reductase
MKVLERTLQEEKAGGVGTSPVPRRVVFVTGGMGGIGSAICRRLAGAGHTIVAGCLPGYEKKEEWLGAMRKDGFQGARRRGQRRQLRELRLDVLQRALGGRHVDILVNNAGITRDRIFKRMTERDWLEVINTNLNSVFNVTRQVVDGMTERGWGRIINISSVNAIKGQFGQTNYSAAKAGHGGLLQGARAGSGEEGRHREHGLAGLRRDRPGDGDPRRRARADHRVDPDGAASRGRGNRRGGRRSSPRKRPGYITGANISVNGGMHMM